MTAILLAALFSFAALLALAVIKDCACRARSIHALLRESRSREPRASVARISVTSWRAVADQRIVALPARSGITASRPRRLSGLLDAA